MCRTWDGARLIWPRQQRPFHTLAFFYALQKFLPMNNPARKLIESCKNVLAVEMKKGVFFITGSWLRQKMHSKWRDKDRLAGRFEYQIWRKSAWNLRVNLFAEIIDWFDYWPMILHANANCDKRLRVSERQDQSVRKWSRIAISLTDL